MTRAILLASSMLATMTDAHAATMTEWTSSGFPALSISGKIEPDDDAKFRRAIASMKQPPRWIYLHSEGGDAEAGLDIAYTVLAAKYETVVGKDATCSSMCALIWLAGSTRWISATGHVGFHALRFTESGKNSPGGNAVIGAYLCRLGFSDSTIRALTEAPPESMQWLTDNRARELGIVAKVIKKAGS
jgi:hypothetical protein